MSRYPAPGTLASCHGIIRRSALPVPAAQPGSAHDDAASRIWSEIYGDLTDAPPGGIGEILCRAEAQVMRMALLLALLDEAPAIGRQHLEAGMKLWRYCEATARYLFGEALLSPKAQKIRDALATGPLTRSEIHHLFKNNASKAQIEAALQELGNGIEVITENVNGKSVEKIWGRQPMP
jgi:hypothetical protein